MNLKAAFKNPGKEFRGIVFWGWNDKLEKAILLQQMQAIKKAGLGGFFMHSRVGLITPYLSYEWMNLVKSVTKKAKQMGLDVWLYDEDRWSSGYGGGIVTTQNPEYRAKGLEYRDVIPSKAPFQLSDNRILRMFLPIYHDNQIADVKMLDKDEAFSPGVKNQRIICFSQIEVPELSWFNGSCCPDVFNPKAVDSFIESTYEAYYREVGEEFGKAIPGIFTDEFQYHNNCSSYKKVLVIPWTEKLPLYFKEKRGYDLLPNLPLLFYKVNNYQKVRYDYWETITELFAESYIRRLFRWCKRHNLKLTGHTGGEESLAYQILCVGDAMVHYEYMHMPGIDHLCKQIEHILSVKQVSSVAHQLGRKRVLSEVYGCSGWDISFADQKWIGNWEYVLGVNFRCLHNFYYSLRGCRKRDFPPGITYQQPWWEYYNKAEDYFARIGYMLTQGRFYSDILLLHPMRSAWVVYHRGNDKKAEKISSIFVELSRTLCKIHRDYDYGNEELIARYGKVRNGKFIVGRGSYKVVIIPPCLTLSSATFKLLGEFFKQGGKIIAIKPLPVMLNGEDSEQIKTFFNGEEITKIDNRQDLLQKTLNQILKPDVMIEDGEGGNLENIYYHHRDAKKMQIYFFANIDKESGYEARIRIKGTGILKVWDLETGNITYWESSQDGEYLSFQFTFPEMGACLMVLEKEKDVKTKQIIPRAPGPKTISKEIIIKPEWEYKRLGPNALVLDYCRYKFSGGEWGRRVPVWQAQYAISNYFGLDAANNRINQGVQFWKAYQDLRDFGEEAEIALQFTFQSGFTPSESKPIFLVMETPERYKIEINRQEFKSKFARPNWWLDRSFNKMDITHYVRRGRNEITINCIFRGDIELENIYIIGDFKVEKKGVRQFSLIVEEGYLHNGDWVKQGYPFYGGTMVYLQDVEIPDLNGDKIYLRFNKIDGIITKVVVNNKSAGFLSWPPYEIEISKFLRLGKNKIRVEVTNSLRNLLGPHHYRGGDPTWTGAFQFSDEKNWTDEYNFVKCGLFGKVTIG